MSVTFASSTQAPPTASVICRGKAGVIAEGLAFLEYRTAYDSHEMTCQDESCRLLGPDCEWSDDPSVNVSNLNARHLLDTLGLLAEDGDEGGLVGALDATDFLGRVLLARGLSPADEGTPAYAAAGPGATMVRAGRAPGYTEDALARLETLAQTAIAAGAQVCWS